MAPSKRNVGFWSNQLCERGTEVAMFDYAFYNQSLLHNKSFVFFERHNPNNHARAIQKFTSHFQVYGVDHFEDIEDLLIKLRITHLYVCKSGENDRKVSKNAVNLVHCIFNCSEPHGEIYAALSPFIRGYTSNTPVLPYMVSIPSHITDDRRFDLNIPPHAVVFGGYGGKESFNIPFVHNVVYNVAKSNPNIYFLFANFTPFCEPLHNIIHLPTIIEPTDKVSFINTCDAMLWARPDGETFGLAIGEFSTMNKPIIATKLAGDRYNKAHVHILGNKALWYHDASSLRSILLSFDKNAAKHKDWNAFKQYTPVHVMSIFNRTFFQQPLPLSKNVDKPKLIDAFPFFNELDMLKLRFLELNNVVDHFVIVEATYTYSGEPKPLYFNNNYDLFKAYREKIVHVVVEDMPNTGNAWDNEHFQRNCIQRGLNMLTLRDHDIVIISDCDEIPDPESLQKVKSVGLSDIRVLTMDMYYYNFHTKNVNQWLRAKIIPFKLLTKLTPQIVRDLDEQYITRIRKGGWHLSYFGDITFIQNKIKAFAHQEFNDDRFLDETHVQSCIANNIDLFNRKDEKWIYLSIFQNEYLPYYYTTLMPD